MKPLSDVFEAVQTLFLIFLGAGIPLALFVLWLKRRLARRRLAEIAPESEPLVGTLDELRRAEAAAAAEPLDVRRTLLEDHVLLDRFPTMRGFSRAYMEDLIRKFESAGISATLYFQETVPMGYMSLVEQHGVFELYVPTATEEAAKRLLDGELKSRQ